MRPTKSLVLPTETTEEYIAEFGDYMRQMRYSDRSIEVYTQALKTFLRFLGNPNVEQITQSDLVYFNTVYILGNGYSSAYQNQVVNAVKLFFSKRPNSTIVVERIERPRQSSSLPVVLSIDEVGLILNGVRNIKHRSMLSLIYSCGLRAGEMIHLKISDIDSTRMVVHIRQAKGKKDRVVPLAENVLVLLRLYYSEYKPKEYLFNGATTPLYSYTSLRTVFKQAIQRTNIRKKCSLHTLRHSYATHLLESGVHLRYIQDILGHNSPKTTMIYTHVSTEASRRVVSPIEKIDLFSLK